MTSNWVSYSKPNPQAGLRLFCFPSAGAGITAFATWANGLPPEVEVASVQLPGRENRLREAPFTCLSTLIPILVEALWPHFTKPFAFFGHSMGALIAYELAHELRRLGKNGLVHLFMSGHRAPHLPERNLTLHVLPEVDLIRELELLNKRSSMVLKDSALRDLMLPIIRADMELCETYQYDTRPPLDCALTALGGTTDPRANYDEMAAWRELTTGHFSLLMFPGDHFYVDPFRKDLLEHIGRQLLPEA